MMGEVMVRSEGEVVWKSEYKKVMLIWEVVGGRV